MSDELDVDVFAEAYELALGFRAHIELLTGSGAYGVPRAELSVARSLSEPPPSLSPAPISHASLPSLPHAAAPQAREKADFEPRGGIGGTHLAVSPARPSGDATNTEPVVAAKQVSDWLTHATAPRVVPAPSETQSLDPKIIATLSPEARRARLRELENEIRDCKNCKLCEKRTQTVFSRGTGSSGLCFVGEGPGADEDQQGAPFVGAAGQLLDRMIAAMGLKRDEVYVCNIVKCRPPENRKPEPNEMKTCLPYLEEQLELLAPEVIVALGATAVEGLLGVAGGITRLRGTWKLYRGRIAVMPTFHPAYLLRAPSAKHAVWDDMKAVLRHLGRPVPERGKKA